MDKVLADPAVKDVAEVGTFLGECAKFAIDVANTIAPPKPQQPQPRTIDTRGVEIVPSSLRPLKGENDMPRISTDPRANVPKPRTPKADPRDIIIMDKEEAWRIFGLHKDTPEEGIRDRYQELMARNKDLKDQRVINTAYEYLMQLKAREDPDDD